MRRRKEGQGCFLALLLACTALVVLLFFFYFKGKDLTWNYLQKGVVERSVLPLLPSDYSEKERKEVQATLNGLFDDIRNERIETARARVIIDELSRMTEDHRLERGEVDRLMKMVREVRGRQRQGGEKGRPLPLGERAGVRGDLEFMKIKFTKMHGLGNDFVILAGPDLQGTTSPIPDSLPDFCRKYSDRRFGIGFDQALIVGPAVSRVEPPAVKADFSMAIYNADGSRVEMCGNGIRCVAKYLWDRGLAPKRELAIETPAGIIRPRPAGGQVAVDMGEPVVGEGPGSGDGVGAEEGGALSLTVKDRQFDLTQISMGNPHAVIFVPEVRAFPVKEYGPLLETHSAFPDRTNVEFVQVIGPQTLRVRVWERGTGETLACGTGACAAAVAAHLHGLTARTVVVHLAGGDLKIHLSENNRVIMTGPAVEVFTGEVEV